MNAIRTRGAMSAIVISGSGITFRHITVDDHLLLNGCELGHVVGLMKLCQVSRAKATVCRRKWDD